MNVVLCLALSSNIELHGRRKEVKKGNDEEPLLPESNTDHGTSIRVKEDKRLLSRISQASRGIIFTLCMLFALDSLASGLVPA